ncbi:hypothetical protein EUGRSUZ_A01342 [Eucalyptus grandis]|uniref:Uncharacterized protein n=2 Tax=Eucalyptus grandis TaxID=71139 RepID=A0ACC3M068_EUCGR|nr:hypothetical protein EUGRSUZ_A01342 [Eucalyptus grandis]
MSLIFMMYSCTPVTLVSFNDEKALPGSVSEINLSSSSLSGRLHALDFASFPNLTCFNVSNNNLKGPIQSSIGNLSELRFLGLGQLQEIQYLGFLNNSLSGSIPYQISNLEKAWHLDFGSNYLESPDWSKFSTMPLVSYLSLFFNLLDGKFRGFVANCQNLTYLAYNRLSGELLPYFFTNWRELISLQLQNNFISRQIPPEIGSLTKLNYLLMYNNSLSGTIPLEVGNLTLLTYLGLSINQLNGEVPKTISRLANLYPSLSAVCFSNNSFTGELPPDLCSGFALQYLAVEGIEWGECKNLTKLQIDGNQITGRIPPELGKLSQLRVLTLHNNDLTGKIPTEMGNLGELLSLNLSNNHLVQDIPILLGNLAKRNYHDLSKNAMSGSIPDEQANCENLLSLNLSYNNLSSVIPPELGNLLALQILLDPTHNSLAGSIPSNLTKLTKLKISIFHITTSRLTGAVPSGCLFQQAPGSAFIRNLGLCGNVTGSSPCETSGKFTFSNITKDTNDFSKEHHIRKGGFGSVYEAVLANGQIVAVKKLNALEPRNISEVNHRSFENEIRMSTEVRHRNVIKFHGFCSSRGCICLVYEFVERGSLAKVLYGGTEAAELDWGTRVKIVQGMAHVIAYLHHNCSLPIVHWDITLNNILLESNLKPWFSNFGMVRLLNSNLPNWTTMAGSYGYMAPELAVVMRVTNKCDMYRFGVVVLEIMTGKSPRDLLSSLSMMQTSTILENPNLLLKDALDPRRPPPIGQPANKVAFIVMVALSCTCTSPDSCPHHAFLLSLRKKFN